MGGTSRPIVLTETHEQIPFCQLLRVNLMNLRELLYFFEEDELRDTLDEFGLPTEGEKAELIGRILDEPHIGIRTSMGQSIRTS